MCVCVYIYIYICHKKHTYTHHTHTHTTHTHTHTYIYIYFLWRCGPTLGIVSSILRFQDHTQRRTTIGRTPLDEWSTRRKDFYLTAQSHQKNIHATGGIRTHNHSKREAADLRLRTRGHWEQRRPAYLTFSLRQVNSLVTYC